MGTATAEERSNDTASAVLPVEHPAFDDCHHLVDEVCSLLRRPDVRLISLWGEPAETRSCLAEAVAAVMELELAGGALLVDLARVRQQSAIGQALAEAMRCGNAAALSILNELVKWMRGRRTLLIVDNVRLVATLFAEGEPRGDGDGDGAVSLVRGVSSRLIVLVSTLARAGA